MGALIEFPFATGIDQRTRPEYADGKMRWLGLDNVRAPKAGGGDKRFGFSVYDTGARAGTADRTAGVRMLSDGITPTVIDGTWVDSFSPTAEAVSRSRVPEATFTTQDLPTVGFNGSVDDITYVNGYLVAVAISGGTSTASYVVVDATTGAIVFGPASAGAADAVSVVSYSTYAVIVLARFGTPEIVYGYINTSTATLLSQGMQAVATDLTGGAWAASDKAYSVTQHTDRVAIAYNTDSGTDRVTVKTFTIAAVLETATIGTASTQPKGVDIDIGPAGDTLWVAYSQGTAVKVVGLTPTSLASVLATSATIITATSTNNYPKIAGGTTAGKARVLTRDAGTFYNTRICGVTTSGGASAQDGSPQRVPGIVPMGRPFCKAGRYYVLVQAGLGTSYASTATTSAILVDWTEEATFVRPVCSVEPNLAVFTGSLEGTGARCKVVTPAATDIRYLAFNVRRSSVANAATLVRIDFASVDRWQPVTFNNSTYLSGGVLGYIDGRSFVEAGFLHRPVKPTTATSGTGITISTGARYVVTFESVDADGNLTISGVSDPSDAFTCSNKTVTVTSQPYATTYRQSSASNAISTTRVTFWRTTDNGGTPPYYRVATVDNDTSAETVTTADTTTDATLITAAKLYSQPGIHGTHQDRRAPPGCPHIEVLNGMLVGASGRNVWYSGQPVIGEAAWFNPIFQVPIDGEGDITALKVQDGTLLVFKRVGVWAVAGDPPSDNGASGGLGAPRRLAVDVGCISQRSVVTTSLGTFFQSDRGIELLTRAQSVEWVGEEVQDEVAARPYIMAATLDPVENLVYFECASGLSAGVVTGTGRALVYDLSLKVWISRDRRTDNAGTADTPAQSACMLYNGTDWAYAWLGTDGKVYRETSSYLDPNSVWVTKTAESAWAKGPGTQAVMKVQHAKLLGKYATDSNIACSMAYDYETSYRSARTYTRAEIAALAAGTGGAGTMPNIQLQHDAHEDGGECMAVRIKISDATPTGGTVGTGQGAVWTGLAFEVTPMEGGYELPDGAR